MTPLNNKEKKLTVLVDGKLKDIEASELSSVFNNNYSKRGKDNEPIFKGVDNIE